MLNNIILTQQQNIQVYAAITKLPCTFQKSVKKCLTIEDNLPQWLVPRYCSASFWFTSHITKDTDTNFLQGKH